VVPVVAGALGVAALAVEAGVVAVAAVGVAAVCVGVVAGVPDVPVLAATPWGWVVTNWVRAASSAVYSLPPPWTEPLPESEPASLSVGPFLRDDRGAPSKDDRLIVVAADIAFVDILHSLLEITRMRGVGARR
jgi:hypothetical protein